MAIPDASPPEPPLDALIVGAGFCGLYALYKLRSLGLRVLAIDAAPSVGGTWWANRYPGARVDIQSLEYSYSFSDALQQDWHWTERYAAQPELLAYANHVADRFDLRRDLRLNTRLAAAHFDEAQRCWRVTTGDGEQLTARFVLLAAGPLSAPNQPPFEGLESFAGTVLHSARWPLEPIDLSGQRVAVIGTGSSGVQMIPRLAAQAASLTVFQRTPAYVVPAHNGPLDPAWEARVKGDYPSFRARNRKMHSGFGCELSPRPMSCADVSPEVREAAFEERWQIGGFSLLAAFPDLLTNPRSNELAGEFVRSKIHQIVHDPAVADRLSPSYPIGCKRLCVESDYYATYNRPNVSLVDLGAQPIDEPGSAGRGSAPGWERGSIEAFAPGGVVVGGREYGCDTLILATGFDAYSGPMVAIDLRGRAGLRMADKWRDGPVNYLGLAVAGFPNLFNLTGPGSTSAFTNFFVVIEHHVGWVADCIGWLDRHGHATIEASEAAEAAWVSYVQAAAGRTVYLSCNAWYGGANVAGKPRMFAPLTAGFPSYADRCAAVASRGYEGFVVT